MLYVYFILSFLFSLRPLLNKKLFIIFNLLRGHTINNWKGKKKKLVVFTNSFQTLHLAALSFACLFVIYFTFSHVRPLFTQQKKKYHQCLTVNLH